MTLTLSFHLPSDIWPEIFPPLRVSSYSQGFLKASRRAEFPARNLMVLRTELKRHHSGYFCWVPPVACVDGAAPRPQVNDWPQEQPSLNALPWHPSQTTACSFIVPAPSKCVWPSREELPFLLPLQPPILNRRPRNSLSLISGFTGCPA